MGLAARLLDLASLRAGLALKIAPVVKNSLDSVAVANREHKRLEPTTSAVSEPLSRCPLLVEFALAALKIGQCCNFAVTPW
jgi:hypothetical protein